MQPGLRNSTRHTLRSVRLPGFLLMASLANLFGCTDEGESEDDVSPSPLPAERSQLGTDHVPPVPAELPDSALVRPPTPVEPPNPATTRPPMDNPGGLNRFRPARPVPGLQ